MLVTLSGIVTLVKPLRENAQALMRVTAIPSISAGMTMLVTLASQP